MNKGLLICRLVVISLFVFFTVSCDQDTDENNDNDKVSTVKDIDGNVYHTITLGTQVWMVENLRTTKYRNGDPIPNVTDQTIWNKLTTGALCDYDNNAAIAEKYGKLYNWYAVNDKRNIAPVGWHVPSQKEWETLRIFVSANIGLSGSEAKALATTIDWTQSDKINAIGNDLTKNNSSGFSALPGGIRDNRKGSQGIGFAGYWWSTDIFNSITEPNVAKYRFLLSSSTKLLSDPYDYYSPMAMGYSVRCVKD